MASKKSTCGELKERIKELEREAEQYKRREKDLLAREERYKEIMGTIEDSYLEVDLGGNFVKFNNSFCNLLGCSKDELRGKNNREFMETAAAKELYHIFLSVYETSKPVPKASWEYIRKDGTKRYGEGSISLVRDDNGKRIGFRGIGRDITRQKMMETQRKQTESKLLKNQYFLQKSQEIGQIGTWELDVLKNKLSWTDETYKIFGIPIGTELTYEIFLNCVHPDDREYVDTEWNAAFNKKKSYDIEHRLLIDGKVKWVREKAELEFDEKNKCIRGTGFAQDITEKKKIEKTLKKWNEKLEKKVTEKMSALSDVNTALRVLLKKREEDKDDISENIYTNYKKLIAPLFKQLRNRHVKNIQEDILDILESSIKDIITPFSKKLSDPMVGLTPTEIQVALLVKEGKTNKEIAQFLIKSIRTISAHRENIRQKFGLKNTKTNLRTYLLSLQ